MIIVVVSIVYDSLIIDIKDHHEVCFALRNIGDAKILKDLGGALGIHLPRLNRMTQLPQDMIASWLRKEDSVQKCSGEPTWSTLVAALLKIGQTGIAGEIQRSPRKRLHQSSNLTASIRPCN